MFPFMDAPGKGAVQAALEELVALGALDGEGELTKVIATLQASNISKKYEVHQTWFGYL